MNPIKSALKTGMSVANEAVLLQQNFERRFLIFKPGQLVLPPIPLQTFFQLPRNAAFHYVAVDGLSRGPNPKDWHLASCDRKMPIQLITDLTRHDGNPTKAAVNILNENDQYLRQHRNLRKSRDVLAEDPGDQSAVIFNYAQLPKLYRYTRSIYTEYHKWSNIWGTVIDKIVAAVDSPRTHLLFLPVPTRLPSMLVMRSMLRKSASSLVRELPDQNSWMFYELWKWIDPETRQGSLFAIIPKEQLNKVVIILEDAGRTMAFNMGTLYSWIADKQNGLSDQRVKIEPEDIQKRLIRGIIGLMQQRPDALGTDLIEDAGSTTDVQGEVRVLTPADDRPQEENVQDSTTFNERVEQLLSKLDEDIAAHNSESVVIEDRVVGEDPLGESVAERGEKAAIQSFEQESKTIEQMLTDRLEENAALGLMTAIDYRKFNRSIEAAANLESPYAPGVSARDYGQVPPSVTDLPEPEKTPDDSALIDKSMRDVVFKQLDGQYIEQILPRDIVGVVQSIQRGGIIVTGHDVSKNESATGVYETHTVRLVPIEGAPSAIRFTIPAIDKGGVIEVNNTKYRFRRQRVDLPIRKISPTQVGLSSYYGKTFVSRCDRSAYDYNKWLQKQVNLRIIEDNSPITKIHTGDCFDHEVKAPRAYTAMAQVWRDMVFQDIEMHFSVQTAVEDFGQDAVDYVKSLNMVVFGKKAGTLYVMDDNNTVYTLRDGNVEPIGTFESMLGLDDSKPTEFTECRIFGKYIPAGVILGYYYGLSALIKMLGVRPRQVPVGTRVNMVPGEWSLAFEDYTLVFSQDDKVATLVLSGLNQAAKVLKRYSVFHFDQPAVYFNLIEAMGMSSRYVRELDNLRDYFVDPMTERVLKRMGEPTTYPQLVRRATEMLVLEDHKRKLDPVEMRYRGAERIAGAIYNQLITSVREQRAKASRNTAKLEMKPFEIMKQVMSDPSLGLIEDINPIHNLKEKASITYTGHGGRSSRSMTRSQRGIDPNDIGSLSEATVDSSLVGFNAYLSVAPRIANTEGMIKDPIGPAAGSASMLSPAALASSCIVNDDSKRIVMASIQHSHTIACESYTNNAVRTGFERVMAHQVDENFATVAKAPGKVKSSNDHGIIVEYEDGTTQSIATGRRFGKVGGMTLPHDMTSVFGVGETFKAGDVLVYHKGFFKPDRFQKGVVNWMNGTIARTVFLEARKTHEDASSISKEFAARVGTKITKIRDIVVSFDKHLHQMVKEGASVKYSDALCLIEDELSAQAGLFTQDRINTLKSLSGQAPLAKVSGIVDRIEVFYHGHPDDMSESLRSIVEVSDKHLARRRKASGKTVVTGAVDDGFRVGGEPLLMDTACIRVYITHYVGASAGDKGVFGWQLKSEISEVLPAPVTTQDGQAVDAFYGATSLFARVVYSAFMIGTTTSLMGTIGKQAAEIYQGKRKP